MLVFRTQKNCFLASLFPLVLPNYCLDSTITNPSSLMNFSFSPLHHKYFFSPRLLQHYCSTTELLAALQISDQMFRPPNVELFSETSQWKCLHKFIIFFVIPTSGVTQLISRPREFLRKLLIHVKILCTQICFCQMFIPPERLLDHCSCS